MLRSFISAFASIAVFASFSMGQVKVGDEPTLQFTAVGGGAVDLHALRGKMVVVDFWATWCGPCMHEASHMVAINKQYSDNGLQMIGISLDNDTASMTKVAADKGFTWPQACDTLAWHSAYAKAWGVESIPQTFIISPDGIVLWRGHPGMIDDVLTQAMKDHPPVLVDPKVLAAANKSLDDASAALSAGKMPAAFKAMGAVPDAAKKNSDFAARQSALATQLADAGEKMLTDVEPLVEQKQYSQAAAQLRDLVKSLDGTPLAKKAQARLDALMKDPQARAGMEADRRQETANAALQHAKTLAASNKPDAAYTAYKSVAKSFPGTPAAAEAATAVAGYEKDTALVKRANEAAAGGAARSALSMGASYASSGREDLARAKYQSVIDQFPGTSYADQAKAALAALGQ